MTGLKKVFFFKIGGLSFEEDFIREGDFSKLK